MAFPTFKSVLSVALLYVLYQGNNVYDVHTISEWKNSKRSRNLSEYFPHKIRRSGENYWYNEHEQHDNARLQKRNYNRTEVSNVMDLYQDVNITGSSWNNYCSQNEKFDSQYWENHEDPYEQDSSIAQEAHEIPAKDPSINTASTSIKQKKKSSEGTSKTRNSKSRQSLEGRNTIHTTSSKNYQVRIFDVRNTNNTKTNEGWDTSKNLSKFEEQLTEKQLKQIIRNLNETVTPGEMINIYNQVTAMEKLKYYEVQKNLAIFWEDLAKEHNIPYSYVARQWYKVHKILSYDLIELEREFHSYVMDLILHSTFINIAFVNLLDKIQFSWEEFTYKKDDDTREYFRKKIKDFYKKEHNTSWF